MSIKSHLGIEIKDCYDRKDKMELENIAINVLPELYNKVHELKAAHKKQWFSTYKPFGWEVIDLRYGGLLASIESAKERLIDYIYGTIDVIDELEQERLSFDSSVLHEESLNVSCNQYHRIVSAGILF